MAVGRKRAIVSGGGEDILITCDASVQKDDYIYFNGTIAELAKANSINTMPCRGQVISKLSSTSCIISIFHMQEGLTGVIDKEDYFISETNAGKLQTNVPVTPGSVFQHIALGVGTTKRINHINPDNAILRK